MQSFFVETEANIYSDKNQRKAVALIAEKRKSAQLRRAIRTGGP